MIDYVGMLKEFHTKYGHLISETPQRHDTIPDEVTDLRQNLIQEEFDEFIDSETREQIADALADLLYVVFGTAVTYGVPIDEVFTEVHRSNMTKPLVKNSAGKTLKGDGYEPPRISEILNKYEVK